MPQRDMSEAKIALELSEWIVKYSTSIGERESMQLHKLLPQNHGLGECGFDPGHEEV